MRRGFVFCLFLFSTFTAPAAVLTTIPYFADQLSSSPIQGVATDPAGNIYIVGTTAGVIPLVHALQPQFGGGDCYLPGKTFIPCPNIFVAKFDPTGTKLIYSTYLGGDQIDFAAGIAVDATGNAYIAGTTQPVSPVPQKGPGNAFVKKLSPDGSALLYTRYIGGTTEAKGIAVDSNGNAVIVGYNIGADFPSLNALPVQPAVRSLYVTRDGGRTWQALNNGLSASSINALAIDPSNPATLYAATSGGFYKSTNAGASWTRFLPAAAIGNTVVIDARRPSTIYVTYTAGSNMYLARSTDAGATWSNLSDNFPPGIAIGASGQIGAFAIDPADSSILWAIAGPNFPTRDSIVLKSTDSGATWRVIYTFPPDDNQRVTLVGRKLLIDPQNSSRLYACCVHNPFVPGTGGVYRSDDGGQIWIPGSTGPIDASTGILSPVLDPRDASILYGPWYYGLQRSIDAGLTWNVMPLPPGLADHGYEPGGLAVDASGTLYLLNDFGYLLKSTDRGASWTMTNGPWVPEASILAVDPTNPGTVYVASGSTGSPAGSQSQHAFAAKLDAMGTIQWATLLGGSGQDQANAVALDASGNAYLTGKTNSDDFPVMNAFQTTRGRNLFPTTDAFVTKIAADGSKLLYSSFMGGDGIDTGNAIAVDAAGNAYVAGSNVDVVYPVVAPAGPQPASANAEAFVTKVDSSGSKLVYQALITGSLFIGQANTIAVDAQGRAIVAGVTGDTMLPLVNPIQPTVSSDFIARLTPAGTPDFSTYLGNIAINSLALGPDGALWVGGGVSSLARIDLQTPALQPGVPMIFEVYNGASFVPGDVALGEIVTLIGQELAPVEQTASGSGSLPRVMQGVSVMIGGVAAPLFYVSPGQINFQVPVELPLGPAQLVVQRGTQISTVRTVSVVAAAPGLFLVNISPQGAPVVVHANDYSLVTAQNPAHPGEYLSAFCTGLGATDPPAQSGEPPAGAASITSSIGVSLDSASVPATYAGLAPGWVGLYQINFRVPDNETAGSKTLYFQMSSNSTNQAAVWVQ